MPEQTDGRRTAAAARRRAREAEIVAATRALFDDKGMREAPIEDIAKAVGINRAIVYRHFTGKEDLFALTMVSYLDELAEILAAVAPASATPEERLTAIVTAFADYALAHPAFVDCAQALMRRPGSELLDEVSENSLLKLRPRDDGLPEHAGRRRSRTASTPESSTSATRRCSPTRCTPAASAPSSSPGSASSSASRRPACPRSGRSVPSRSRPTWSPPLWPPPAADPPETG